MSTADTCNQGPSRPQGCLFRALGNYFYRRQGGRAALSRLLHPRPGRSNRPSRRRRYLLLHGELPSKAELARIDADLKAARQLPPPILSIIETVKAAHPMDVLRTAVSALAAFDPEVGDNSREATVRKGDRLTSQVPMIVAAHDRIRNGKAPVAPDADARPRRQLPVDAEGREAVRRTPPS